MSVLLIVEHNNKEVKPFTLNAITAASQIDQDLHAIVIGNKADTVVKSISEVPNVKKVIHIDNEIYENYLPENFTSAIVKNSENYSQRKYFYIIQGIEQGQNKDRYVAIESGKYIDCNKHLMNMDELYEHYNTIYGKNM